MRDLFLPLYFHFKKNSLRISHLRKTTSLGGEFHDEVICL